MAEEKKRPKKRHKSGVAPAGDDVFGDYQQWKKLDFTDQMIMGGDEGGFFGLEVLEDIPDDIKERLKTLDNVARPRSDAENDEGGAHNVKQKKKRKRKHKSKASAAKADPEDASQDDPEAAGTEVESCDLSAWSAFGLHEKVLKGLGSLKFSTPTEIQQACLPAAVGYHQDIIGAAETGSGKTLAFGLPILHHLLVERDRREAAAEAEQQAVVAEEEEEEEEELGEEGDAAEEEAEESGDEEVEDGDEDGEGDSDQGEAQELEEGEAVDMLAEIKAHEDRMRGAAPRDAGGRLVTEGHLRALIICPTRELALQVHDHLKAVAAHCRLRICAIVGGISEQKQKRLLKGRPEIVVATPGRLWEYMQGGEPHLAALHAVSFLVIDEADRMVERGHFAELQSILHHLPLPAAPPKGKEGNPGKDKGRGKARGAPEAVAAQSVKRQTFVFSATLTLPPALKAKLKHKQTQAAPRHTTDTMEQLMGQVAFKGKPSIVDRTSAQITARKLSESVIQCTDDDRDFYLYYLVNRHPGRTIVFCNSIAALRRISAILKILEVSVCPLHASMQQRQRLKALDRFKKGATDVLVATDVAARGLDIPNVRCVIHYQIPLTADAYIHRSGRTARAQDDGLSIALVTPSDRHRYMSLSKALAKPDGLPDFPVDEAYMPAVRHRCRLAFKVDTLSRQGAKEKASKTWYQKNAEALDLEVEEDSDTEERSRTKEKSSVEVQRAQQALHDNLQGPLLPAKQNAFKGKFLGEGAELAMQQARGSQQELSKVEALQMFSEQALDKPTPAIKKRAAVGGRMIGFNMGTGKGKKGKGGAGGKGKKGQVRAGKRKK